MVVLAPFLTSHFPSSMYPDPSPHPLPVNPPRTESEGEVQGCLSHPVLRVEVRSSVLQDLRAGQQLDPPILLALHIFFWLFCSSSRVSPPQQTEASPEPRP
eukprot:375674-Hanusia_phi.AAC.1